MSENENKNNESNQHNDGIEESDNPLPRWWLITFYLTIAFSVGYFIYYTFGNGPSLVDEFHTAINEREIALRSQPKNEKVPDEKELLALSKDSGAMGKARAIFTEKCASCHGDKGQGIIGPNLTDKYWVHGNKATNLAEVIQNGVPEKGMPGWGPILAREEIFSLAAFIKTLKGTNPPNPKASEGKLYEE